MSWLLLLPLCAQLSAITREEVMDNAAIFSTHEWTMGSANQYASCSSSYVSDWTPGETYRGLPYDWGGFSSTSEYDSYIAQGYGAGSHSWHGVLWCTVGLDCSGFVSRAWDTDTKYGTSTFYQVTSEISSSALLRGDALNNAGSHIVLYAYETAAGLPVHYEADGSLVYVDNDGGWSSFSSYTPVRYDDISDGSTTGTVSTAHEITAFPFEDLRWTAGAASDAIDSYSCSPDTDESGPEQFYHFEVSQGGTLDLRVSDDSHTDVDIHVLDAPDGDGCLARAHEELSLYLEPGEHWITADTWVGSTEFAGPYILTATFTGTLGDAPDDDSGQPDVEDSGQPDVEDTGVDDDPGGGQGARPPPGQRVLMSDHDGGGCGCHGAAGSGGLLLALLALVGLRRRQ